MLSRLPLACRWLWSPCLIALRFSWTSSTSSVGSLGSHYCQLLHKRLWRICNKGHRTLHTSQCTALSCLPINLVNFVQYSKVSISSCFCAETCKNWWWIINQNMFCWKTINIRSLSQPLLVMEQCEKQKKLLIKTATSSQINANITPFINSWFTFCLPQIAFHYSLRVQVALIFLDKEEK